MNILTLKRPASEFVKVAVFIINNHFGRSGIVQYIPIMSISKMWR